MDVGKLMNFKPETPDVRAQHAAAGGSGQQRKRKSRFEPAADDDDAIANAVVEAKRREKTAEEIAEIVDNAEAAPLLDEGEVKKMILKLEKAALKNQQHRIKFADSPDKFLESELELVVTLQEMHAISTVPQHYTHFMSVNFVQSLSQLLSHENTDVVAEVIYLLHELTDVEYDDLDDYINELLNEHLMSTLTLACERMDESVKEESDAVHNALAIIESICEYDCGNCLKVVDQGVLQWLLKRLKVKGFDPNKLYCAELLTVLLQNHDENRSQLKQLDGIDIILQQLAVFKRHDPGSREEEELMENLFDAMCSTLMLDANKEKFLKGEGLQLMNLMLREKKKSKFCAVKVLDFALAGPSTSELCQKFIDILGLRSIFPLFVKASKAKRRMSQEELEEHLISVIASLIRHCHGSQRDRLLAKFVENDHEKVDRLMELHFDYMEKVEAVDALVRRRRLEEGDVFDEDEAYMKRLDAGLFSLQLIDYILIEIVVSGASSIKKKVVDAANLRGASLKKVNLIIKEYAENMSADDASAVIEKARILEILSKFSSK